MDLFYQSMYIIRANCMEGFCEADLYITSDKFDHNEFFHLDMEPFPLKSAYELKWLKMNQMCDILYELTGTE